MATLSAPAPAPAITSAPIDWAQTPLLEYTGKFASVLHDVLTAAECDALVASATAATPAGWERAKIEQGDGTQAVASHERNCDRILWDDAATADWLWQRVAPHLEPLRRVEQHSPIVDQAMLDTALGAFRGHWRAARLSPRLRFLRYGPGEFFKPHFDNPSVSPDGKQVSLVTLQFYLGEVAGGEPLQGGATTFLDLGDSRYFHVAPRQGSVLVFQQNGLLHAGQEVRHGTKLTMRTEIMYEKAEE